jgi:uncharacterized protein DUF3606
MIRSSTSSKEIAMLVDKERLPRDLSQVGLTDEWEVRYWCTRFSVGADELRACVMEVGPHVDNVERRLKEAARMAFDKTGED